MLRPKPDLITEVFERFASDKPPPTSLRAGVAQDDCEKPPPYDGRIDVPTDEYLEQYAHYACFYLDSQSKRFYLPYLMEYSLNHVADMGASTVVEALLRVLDDVDVIRSKQEARVVVDGLTILAFDPTSKHKSETRTHLEALAQREL